MAVHGCTGNPCTICGSGSYTMSVATGTDAQWRPMTSWECHRCGAVNAPHVGQCTCRAPAGQFLPLVPRSPFLPPEHEHGPLPAPIPQITCGVDK